MKLLLHGIVTKLFGRHLEFRVRLFNILASAGTFISSSMCVTGIATHAGFVNVLLNFIVSITLGFTMAMHFRLYNQQQRELEAARKQAEEYSRMKSELFADMSHEMRTPLTIMSTYAQYAAEQIRFSGTNEQTLADLATISDEAKRLAEMADGTLKIMMSTNEAGRREVASIDIGVLVARLARLFGAIAARKGRSLTTDVKETIPPLLGDIDSLTQLLWNILNNAVTYSDGDVTLIARSDTQTVQIIVTDNGPGIPPDLLPHIFDRGVSGKENGIGIGLFLCREIARKHNGDIVVECGPSAGTSVIVTLPIIREERTDG